MRGDVVLATFPEPAGRRPGVIVTRDAVIPVLGRLTLVPITGTRRGLATEVELDESNGLGRASVASCDNITTIPRADIHQRLGSLGPERRRQLDDALRIALELDE